jgi:hypothetical protein
MKTQPEVDTTYPDLALYSDAACNTMTQQESYGSVVDADGNDWLAKYSSIFPDNKVSLFVPKNQFPKFQMKNNKKNQVGREYRMVTKVRYGDYKQQNNSGELKAFELMLDIALKLSPSVVPCIYTDSNLVRNYWSKGLVSKEKREEMQKNCPEKLALIEQVAAKRKLWQSAGGKVELISGDENPADLGYHRSKKRKPDFAE